MTRTHGWRQDLEDVRDYKLGAVSPVLPASADLSKFVPNILDQGGLGSCVANALSYANLIADGVAGKKQVPMSRLFAWWHSRNQHGDATVNTGTYIRTCIKVLNILGRPPEASWPYVETKFAIKPGILSNLTGYDNRKTVYSRISNVPKERIDQIKHSIADNKPVVFGTGVTDEFVHCTDNRYFDVPKGAVAGGHAMCMVGYTDKGIKLVNSWSPNWGDNGFGYMTWDYVCDPSTNDLWSISE